MINAVETLGGRKRLADLYNRYVAAPRAYGDFFDAAIELLELDVRYPMEQLAKIPVDGPVLFIANHPYGVIDGLVLIWLARKARPDIKVLTHKVLCQAPEAREHLLPIDFSTDPGALANNVHSRREALRHLQNGGAIGIFPAGAVSASPAALHGPAVDIAWHPFAAKLSMLSKATVVPIYFAGQNSRIFQLASHLSYTWRLSLFFWETARRIGTALDVAVGDPIAFEDLDGNVGREKLLSELRHRTYDLAATLVTEPKKRAHPDQEYKFPKHFKL
ncbi:MAG: lysophospholipid acyltransferase family protein [Pseudomonadota bacterium]